MKSARFSTGGVAPIVVTDGPKLTPNEAPSGHLTGYKTKQYRTYVLLILLLAYALNSADRAVMSVLAQAIISTFHLTDSQWGLLSGPPFAMFYALMGLPLAAWADRSKRVTIMAFCVLMWSIMTALCGIASGFLTLLVFRLGVAIGEAGAGPISNSLIGDYFKPTERPKVLSIWALGVPIGIIAANLFGGAIAGLHGDAAHHWGGMGLSYLLPGIFGVDVEGWRLAFMWVGAPGLLVAPLIYFSVKEPPRGYSDPPTATPKGVLSFASSFNELLSKHSYWWMVLGGFQIGLVIYGVISFQAPLLQRSHGLSVEQAALQFGLPIAVAGCLGTVFCGWLVEKLTSRYFSAVAWIPAIGAIVAAPCYLIAFHSSSLAQVRVFWLLATFCHYATIGSQYAIGQGVVSSRSRATSIAVLLFIVSGLGGSAGPYLLGGVSDFLTSSYLRASSVAVGLSPHLCKIQSNLTDAQVHACRLASSQGLLDAISLVVCILIPAGCCFAMCAKGLKKDYVLGGEG
jgi:predicted MFS family arabinose efflux permease